MTGHTAGGNACFSISPIASNNRGSLAPAPGGKPLALGLVDEPHEGKLDGQGAVFRQCFNQDAISAAKARQYTSARSRLSSARGPCVLIRNSGLGSKLRWCLRGKSSATRGISNSLRSAWVIGGSRLIKLMLVESSVIVLDGRGNSCAGYSQLDPLDERCDVKGVEGGAGIECLAFVFFSTIVSVDDASVKHVSIELRLPPCRSLFIMQTWGWFCEGDLDCRKFPLMMSRIYSLLFRPTQIETVSVKVVEELDYPEMGKCIFLLCSGTIYHLCCAFARVRWHSLDIEQSNLSRL